MKDGTTHLAYKAEHAVDLDTDAGACRHDLSGRSRPTPTRWPEGVVQAQLNVIKAESPANIKEVVADEVIIGSDIDRGQRDAGHSHVHSRAEPQDGPWDWSERAAVAAPQ